MMDSVMKEAQQAENEYNKVKAENDAHVKNETEITEHIDNLDKQLKKCKSTRLLYR
jgi:archaellum component FlaC